eukprot:5789932-Alexandrium_andersonii.AAC.1
MLEWLRFGVLARRVSALAVQARAASRSFVRALALCTLAFRCTVRHSASALKHNDKSITALQAVCS